MMPGMDGFETCRKIKQNPETTHIPVVMVTALSDIEDRVKGLEAGADEFLTKPINRNSINAELGATVVELKDDFSESKILLFDDDLVQAKNIKDNLSEISTQVKVLTSPNEVDSLGAFIPDIVIISCQISTAIPFELL